MATVAMAIALFGVLWPLLVLATAPNAALVLASAPNALLVDFKPTNSLDHNKTNMLSSRAKF